MKKGDYVVLLSYPGGNAKWKSMPLNYVYKLFKDSNQFNFTFEKDNDGICNGWSFNKDNPEIKKYSLLKFREANHLEILEYDKFNKPCEAIKPKKDNYKYLIKLFKQLNIK